MSVEVTVELEDLRRLVKKMCALSIECRAQQALRVYQIPTNRKVVAEYVAAYRLAVPEARKQERALYGDFLKSLKSGNNVRQTLSSFVARVATSQGATDKKVRPFQ
jgi:hypothetical protein